MLIISAFIVIYMVCGLYVANRIFYSVMISENTSDKDIEAEINSEIKRELVELRKVFGRAMYNVIIIGVKALITLGWPVVFYNHNWNKNRRNK